jgi:hypothetical protein
MPSVTTWNRIEPRCRSLDLKAGLEARVYDPLWLLTRQWQVGEFQGRATGSPVAATVEFNVARIDRFSVAGQAPQVYDGRKPIEILVEQEAIRPGGAASDYRQAAEAGLYFLRLLNAAQLPPAIWSLYLAQYPLTAATGDAQTISSLIAGRVIDGIKLHADLIAAGGNLPNLPVIPAGAQHDTVLKVTRDWLAWYGSLFSEPAQSDGWSEDRMEYGFAMGVAGAAGSYATQEYDGGSADWYTFNLSVTSIAGGTAQPSGPSEGVVPTPVIFRGMPARRFWEMEDGGTNIAQLSAAAEDLGRILLREFALVYGNDWFQFPLTVQVGSQVEITSLIVVDTFGSPITIPHYSSVDGTLAKWRLFTPTSDPSSAPATTAVAAASPHAILITPSAVVPLAGPDLEEVLLLRDELANLAWGIERTVSGPSGQPFDRTTAWNTSLPIASPPAADATPLYRLGSTVPDYWIPFVPVQDAGAGSSLQLRRGKLPTSSAGPLGRMLAEAKTIFLEEIPREGVLLDRRYRLARGLDGSVYLWIGRQRSVGKGEGRSGLRFDFLE